jgi:hypothetical protein
MTALSAAGTATGNSGAGSGTITTTLATGLAAGDIAFVQMDVNGTTTWAVPSGWTELGRATNGSFISQIVIWRAWQSGDTAPGIGIGGTSRSWTAVSWGLRGVDTAQLGKFSANGTGNSTTPGVTTALTAEQPNTYYLITVGKLSGTNNDVLPPTGATQLFEQDNSTTIESAAFYKPQASAGSTGSITCPAGAISSRWVAQGFVVLSTDYPTFRAASAVAGGFAVTTATPVKPAGTASGDVMVAVVRAMGNAPTVNAPTGWTQRVRVAQGTLFDVQLWTKVSVGADELAWTVSGTGTGISVALLTYYRVDTTTPFDAGAGTDNGASAISGQGSTTTLTTNAMVVAFSAQGSGAATTVTIGMFERLDSSAMGADDAVQLIAGATGTETLTWSTTGATATIVAALRHTGEGVAAVPLFVPLPEEWTDEPDRPEDLDDDQPRQDWNPNLMTDPLTVAELLAFGSTVEDDDQHREEWAEAPEDATQQVADLLDVTVLDLSMLTGAVATLADVEPTDEWEPEDERGTWEADEQTAPVTVVEALAVLPLAEVEPDDAQEVEPEDERGSWGSGLLPVDDPTLTILSSATASLADVEPEPGQDEPPDDEHGDWYAGEITLAADPDPSLLGALAALADVEPDESQGYEREDELSAQWDTLVQVPLTVIELLRAAILAGIEPEAEASPESDDGRQDWGAALVSLISDMTALLSLPVLADVEPDDTGEQQPEDERGAWHAGVQGVPLTIVAVLVAGVAALADIEPEPVPTADEDVPVAVVTLITVILIVHPGLDQPTGVVLAQAPVPGTGMVNGQPRPGSGV